MIGCIFPGVGRGWGSLSTGVRGPTGRATALGLQFPSPAPAAYPVDEQLWALSPLPQPRPHTQLMSTYFGRAAWESLTLQKPYITFWFSKCPESSCKPPSRVIRRVSGLSAS